MLSWTPAPASAPERAPSRGDERLQERAEWRGFGGSARPSVQPGAAGGAGRLGTLSTTHTLVGRFAQLTQALPARRGHLEEPHPRHIHTYIHPYICEHRHTSRTPAPTGHSHQLGICFGARTISSGDTQPVAIGNYRTIGWDTGQCQTHKHNLVPSCMKITASVRQTNAQNLVPCTYR